MSLTVRLATAADVAELAPRLREADLAEIALRTGEAPAAVLERGLRRSAPCYAAVAGESGRAAALFGVVPGGDGTGIVWLLGSAELVAAGSAFARLSRGWVERLGDGYSVLWNEADARNHVHRRWLEWCGFTPHHSERRGFVRYVRAC